MLCSGVSEGDQVAVGEHYPPLSPLTQVLGSFEESALVDAFVFELMLNGPKAHAVTNHYYN